MFDRLLDLVFVPRCVACGTRMEKSGDGLCDACRRSFEHAKDEYCDFCGMTAVQCLCMPQNLLRAGCLSYRKLLFYNLAAFCLFCHMIYEI